MKILDYSKNRVPEGYKCSLCEATNCKLWYNIEDNSKTKKLFCCHCLCRIIKPVELNPVGKRYLKELRIWTNQIDVYDPAIPKREDNGLWYYFFAPKEAICWWERLPNFPK